MDRRIYGLENEYGVTCTFRGQRRLLCRGAEQQGSKPKDPDGNPVPWRHDARAYRLVARSGQPGNGQELPAKMPSLLRFLERLLSWYE